MISPVVFLVRQQCTSIISRFKIFNWLPPWSSHRLVPLRAFPARWTRPPPSLSLISRCDLSRFQLLPCCLYWRQTATGWTGVGLIYNLFLLTGTSQLSAGGCVDFWKTARERSSTCHEPRCELDEWLRAKCRQPPNALCW